ncbi:phage tail terminator protein [Glaciecola sp. 1036]|uniref:phage tail terminator protein n=1 Tax=Alteromonadaceae TaxID=72275 RepID=UPI003D0465A6
MLLLEIEDQVKHCFDIVQHAVSLRVALSQPLTRSTMGFIVPIAERPNDNARDVDVGSPLQEVLITFGVVTAIQSINDKTGAKTAERLEKIREDIRQALYGYKPQEHEPVLIGASDLLQFVNGGLFWVDRFTTRIWRSGCDHV